MIQLPQTAIKCEHLWRKWKSLMLLFQWLSALPRWHVHHSFQFFSSLNECLFPCCPLFLTRPFIFLSIIGILLTSQSIVFLPSTCANVLNSSIYLWKQLIVFYRRISPILSFRYSFYVLYILFRSHTHTNIHTQLKSDNVLSSDEQWT